MVNIHKKLFRSQVWQHLPHRDIWIWILTESSQGMLKTTMSAISDAVSYIHNGQRRNPHSTIIRRSLTDMAAWGNIEWSINAHTVSIHIPKYRAYNGGIQTPISDEIASIVKFFHTCINGKCRYTKSIGLLIEQRLRGFNNGDLCRAIENVKNNRFWRTAAGRNGMGWFFKNDEQIDKFLNLTFNAEVSLDALKQADRDYQDRQTQLGGDILI